MSDGGLSSARLEGLRAMLAEYVERGTTPGVVAIVARHGRLHVETSFRSWPSLGCRARSTARSTRRSRRLVTVLMTPTLWSSPQRPPMFRDFWTAASQAIDD